MKLGIDPGQSGALCVMNDQGEILAITKGNNTEHDISRFIGAHPIKFAMIEKVHSMPGQGVSSTFKFGMNYGFLRGLLVAHKIPFEEITPGKWQSHFGLKGKGKGKTEHKNVLKGHAQQLYPDHKITLWNADAILIARYCVEKKL